MHYFWQETSRKLRVAQSNLLESEQSRERRLKIMKKTHSSALSLKQALIQDLQDIIGEREESISELEVRLQGCSCGHVKDKDIKHEVDNVFLFACNRYNLSSPISSSTVKFCNKLSKSRLDFSTII